MLIRPKSRHLLYRELRIKFPTFYFYHKHTKLGWHIYFKI